jgi:hypothetical protein
MAREVITWVLKSLARDPQIVADRIQVERIRRVHLEEVCPNGDRTVLEEESSAHAAPMFDAKK